MPQFNTWRINYNLLESVILVKKNIPLEKEMEVKIAPYVKTTIPKKVKDGDIKENIL